MKFALFPAALKNFMVFTWMVPSTAGGVQTFGTITPDSLADKYVRTERCDVSALAAYVPIRFDDSREWGELRQASGDELTAELLMNSHANDMPDRITCYRTNSCVM